MRYALAITCINEHILVTELCAVRPEIIENEQSFSGGRYRAHGRPCTAHGRTVLTAAATVVCTVAATVLLRHSR